VTAHVADPVGPSAAVQVLYCGPVTWQQWRRDSQAPPMKKIPYQAHLWRGAAETMNEQHPDGASLQEERGWIEMRM
jgi:hypothetical protein